MNCRHSHCQPTLPRSADSRWAASSPHCEIKTPAFKASLHISKYLPRNLSPRQKRVPNGAYLIRKVPLTISHRAVRGPLPADRVGWVTCLWWAMWSSLGRCCDEHRGTGGVYIGRRSRAHSVSCTSAIELGVVGTLVGTELVPCSSHFGTPHHPSLCAQESAIHQSHLGTLQRPDPEWNSLSQ